MGLNEWGGRKNNKKPRKNKRAIKLAERKLAGCVCLQRWYIAAITTQQIVTDTMFWKQTSENAEHSTVKIIWM